MTKLAKNQGEEEDDEPREVEDGEDRKSIIEPDALGKLQIQQGRPLERRASVWACQGVAVVVDAAAAAAAIARLGLLGVWHSNDGLLTIDLLKRLE